LEKEYKHFKDVLEYLKEKTKTKDPKELEIIYQPANYIVDKKKEEQDETRRKKM